MKKTLLFMLCLFLFPVMTYAKESCTIVNGTGNDIGDEIKCGTESFYVVSSDQNEVSLLAKYNLLVGDKIDYFEVDNGIEYSLTEVYDDYALGHIDISYDAMEDCFEYAEEKGYNPYYVHPIMNEYNEKTSTLLGCRVYEKLETEHIRQDEKAIGTKIVDGKSVLPIYGVTYMHPYWGYEAMEEGIPNIIEYDESGDVIYENSSFYNYIIGYQEELEEQGIDVTKVSFITLSKTIDLLETISGKQVINQLEWAPYDDMFNLDIDTYIGKMDIKEYIGNNYKWISGTTYWLGSGFINDDISAEHVNFLYNDFYISNEGLLCALGRGECAWLPYPIGNGLRPLVTLAKSSLMYNISTKTDGNGTIEVVNTAHGNDNISFKITPKKGYKLSKLVVTTDSGKIIEFNDMEDVSNGNGTINNSNNEFIMPFEHVTIEAKWEIENPKTGNSNTIGLILTIVFCLISILFVLKTYNKSYEL